jgi:hypothetical protein
MTKFESAVLTFKTNIHLFTWDSMRSSNNPYAKDIMTNENNDCNVECGLNLVQYIISDLDYWGCLYPTGKMPMYDNSKRQAAFVRMVNAAVPAKALNDAQAFMNNPHVEFESIVDEAIKIETMVDFYSGKHHSIKTYFFNDGSMIVHNGAKTLYITE